MLPLLEGRWKEVLRKLFLSRKKKKKKEEMQFRWP